MMEAGSLAALEADIALNGRVRDLRLGMRGTGFIDELFIPFR